MRTTPPTANPSPPRGGHPQRVLPARSRLSEIHRISSFHRRSPPAQRCAPLKSCSNINNFCKGTANRAKPGLLSQFAMVALPRCRLHCSTASGASASLTLPPAALSSAHHLSAFHALPVAAWDHRKLADGKQKTDTVWCLSFVWYPAATYLSKPSPAQYFRRIRA